MLYFDFLYSLFIKCIIHWACIKFVINKRQKVPTIRIRVLGVQKRALGGGNTIFVETFSTKSYVKRDFHVCVARRFFIKWKNPQGGGRVESNPPPPPSGHYRVR